METSKFDRLLRSAAQQASRRETLGALIGAALLLNHRGEIEATEKAKRRRKRKRRARQQAGSWVAIRTMNHTNRSVSYSTGRRGWPGKCCEYLFDSWIPASSASSNAHSRYDANPWIWLDDGKYWFEFAAPWAYGPIAKIAVNGRFAPPSNCCNGIPFGQTVHHRFELPRREGQSVEINIAGKVFSIERDQNDDDLHRFTIHIPPDA